MTLILPRRKFLTGLAASLIAAPAIVRAANLMPIKVIKPDTRLVRIYPMCPSHQLASGGSPICRADGTPLMAGDLVAGQIVTLNWNVNHWVLA